MTAHTRTPDGLPHRCPVCGKPSLVEPSYPGGDSCCPHCGQLLWWFRDRIGPDLQLSALLAHAGAGVDSLDLVELIMELEEKFDVSIPDYAAERLDTIADAIRLVQKLLDERDAP